MVKLPHTNIMVKCVSDNVANSIHDQTVDCRKWRFLDCNQLYLLADIMCV